jgi:hypothetical protein
VRAAAFVALAVAGSFACGGLLGLAEPTILDGGGDDGSVTGDDGPVTGEESAGSDDSGDGANADSSGDASDSAQGDGASAECAPVAGNLLGNPDFEQGCAPWRLSASGTVDPSDQAHCGSKACQICSLALNNNFFATLDLPVLEGEEYTFSAFVRNVDAASTAVAIGMLDYGPDGGGVVGGGYGAVTATYHATGPAQRVQDASSTLLHVWVGFFTPDGGGCVLVDDAVLLRTRDAGGD